MALFETLHAATTRYIRANSKWQLAIGQNTLQEFAYCKYCFLPAHSVRVLKTLEISVRLGNLCRLDARLCQLEALGCRLESYLCRPTRPRVRKIAHTRSRSFAPLNDRLYWATLIHPPSAAPQDRLCRGLVLRQFHIMLLDFHPLGWAVGPRGTQGQALTWIIHEPRWQELEKSLFLRTWTGLFYEQN